MKGLIRTLNQDEIAQMANNAGKISLNTAVGPNKNLGISTHFAKASIAFGKINKGADKAEISALNLRKVNHQRLGECWSIMADDNVLYVITMNLEVKVVFMGDILNEASK